MRPRRCLRDRRAQLRLERHRHGISIVTPLMLALPVHGPARPIPATIGGCISQALARRLAELAQS